MLSSRDRVLCVLNHEEPDRVPIFFGTSGATTMLAAAYERLKAYLGIDAEAKLLSRTMQYARIDEEVLVRFGSDGRALIAGPAPAPLRQEKSRDVFIDDWGAEWHRRPGSPYYHLVDSLLRDVTIDDLETYPWPDLSHPDRFTGLADKARAVQAAGYATVVMSDVCPFEIAGVLRGLDTWFVDLLLNPEFASALFRKLTDVTLAGTLALLEEVGEYADVLVMADDLGTQGGPLISPELYRNMIKPYHAELIGAIKRKTCSRSPVPSIRRYGRLTGT